MNLLLGGGHEPTLIASGRADPDADDGHDCKQTWLGGLLGSDVASARDGDH